MAPVVRQAVSHRPSTTQRWRQIRRTVGPLRVRARQQQEELSQRDAPSLPRAHKPEGQLNNAVPKAKRRAPDDRSVQLAVRDQDEGRVVAAQLRNTAVPTSAEPADVQGCGRNISAGGSGQHSTSGTVIGAIALITGAHRTVHDR